MRLVERIFLFATVVVVPAAVGAVGCTVEPERYPPPSVDTGKTSSGATVTTSTSGSTASTSGGTTTSTGTGGGFPGSQACQCAVGIYGSANPGCSNCAGAVATPTGTCAGELAACEADSLCQSMYALAASCAANADPGTCMAGVVDTNTAFRVLVECQCTQCGSQCGSSTPIACDLTPADAGTGGAGGGDGG